jgi:hypothetical protein
MKILANLWAGISAKAAEFGIYALLAAAIFMAGYFRGAGAESTACANKERDVAIAYAGLVVEAQGRADELAAENDRYRAAQAPKDRIITKEVARYVQVTNPADRCRLPGTWRVRHDLSATGEPAGAGAGPLADGAADFVEDAAALDTVAENYASCRDAIAKLEGWQRRQRALEGPAR